MKHHILKPAAISLSFACVIMTANLAAQDLGSVAKQAQSMGMGNISGLVQKLHLSPDQVQQVLPILQKEFPKLQAIQGSSTLTDKQKVSQATTVQHQSDSKLKSILSPQQLLSLKDFRAQQLQEVIHGAMPH